MADSPSMAEPLSNDIEGIEDDDSEWEYEYHETETEDFYVTLDLSSAVPKSNLPDPTPQTPAAAAETTSTPNITAEQNGGNSDNNDSSLTQPEQAPGRIQILDLHSPNPIISYKNQIYSCQWTSTLGTDILLTTPSPSFPHPVLKEEPNVSIIAATSIKLFGRPADLTAHPNPSAENEAIQPAAQAAEETSTTTSTSNNQPKPTTDPAPPFKIPSSLTTTKEREKQARFLERLMAIKAAKGEKDEVTVYARNAQKPKAGPGRRSRKRGVQEGDAATAVEDDSDPSTPTAPRASIRGRGRAGRPRRNGGRGLRSASHIEGVFHDEGQQPDSSLTPESWDQLGEPSTLKTPPCHPQASSPKTAPTSTPSPHLHLPPSPSQHPNQTSSPSQPRAESAHEGIANAATGRGADGPSLVGGEGMIVVAADDGERSAVVDVGVGIDADAGAGDDGDDDDGNVDDDGDVEMEIGGG